MKTLFLLCAVISVALILGSCANQNNSATATSAPRLDPQSGVVGGGSGGGGGTFPGRGGMGKQQP